MDYTPEQIEELLEAEDDDDPLLAIVRQQQARIAELEGELESALGIISDDHAKGIELRATVRQLEAERTQANAAAKEKPTQ